LSTLVVGSAALGLILQPAELRLLLFLEALLYPLAQVLREFKVALPADRLRIPRSEVSFLEQLLTSVAEEVLFMIGLVEELLAAVGDGLFAECAIVTEELNVMRLAIGQTVVLVVMRLDEGLVADVTSKVVRVPHFAQGSDGTTLTGFTALSALLEQQDFVVWSAVVVTLELVAVAAFEFDTALLTTEVPRVHELALDEEVGSNDRFVAHGALMGLGANDAHLLLHAHGAIYVLGLRLNLVALADKVCTAADTNEVL